MEMKAKVVSSPLLSLLELGAKEKEARGLRFTPHEIYQQPDTWHSTYKRCIDKAPELKRFLEKSGVAKFGVEHRHQLAPVVFLVGAGTSDYVGRALTSLLRARWQCDAWAVPSTDLLTNLESLIMPGRNYLWISFSRSGDSPEGVAVLEKTLTTRPLIRHLVITCNANGKMARICSSHPERTLALVLDPAVNDRGLAMTSSFTNMVVAGQCLAHLPDAQRDGASGGKYGEILAGMSEVARRFLDNASVCAAEIAAMGFSRACFVGSGVLAAVANESALKLLELTAGKLQTLSESALGLRHGPMSAVDGNSLFVAFLSGKENLRRYEIDLLQEIREKRLGKATLVVTPQPYERLNSLADFIVSLDAPDALEDEYRVPVDIILGQLLGLFCSLNAGLQPDNPSPNGVISRVVSRFNIY